MKLHSTASLALALSLVACKHSDNGTPEQSTAAPPTNQTSGSGAAPAKPAPMAEDVLKAQLEAVKRFSDSAPMDATFAPDAVVLMPNGERHAAGGNVASAIAFLDPGATVKDATFDHVSTGGNANVTWFAADLHFTVTSGGSKPQKHTVRAVELLDGAADWKVAVAAFTNVDKLASMGSCPISDATPPGVLTNLLVQPASLAAALAPEGVVLGTDPAERAQGVDAKALLGTWSKLELSLDAEQKAREVHTAAYGYAMTNVKLAPIKADGEEQAMSAFVLALPGPNNTWSVVAASYGATF